MARAPIVEGAQIRLGAKSVPLRSAAMHYWRVPPDAWGAGLERIVELGTPIVETYVPWGVHETAAGQFDFGETDPRKDLGAFVDLAGELGLRVFLRPGPHINAEMTYFGLPRRVVLDPECQARSPRGNPVILYLPPKMFPVPSYASEAYHEEVGRWFDAVAPHITPRLWPDGPVVLLQVDNEAGFFFRNGPFCQDYHDDAVGMWHSFLDERHGGLPALATAHGTKYSGWADVVPPTSFDASFGKKGGHGRLALHVDWAAFQEHLLARAVGRMRRRMERAGMRAPMVHNVSLGDGGLPVSVVAFDREVDLVGLDYYHAAREHETIKRRTLYLSGSVETAYSPELGIGAPPWFTPLSHGDSLYCAMASCAYGLRGFNLYMAVDRDRWYGAPIDVRGRARAEATDWKRLMKALEEVRFESLQSRTEVALMWPREYQRLTRATHQLGAVSPSNLEALGGKPTDGCRGDDFGFEQPMQIAWFDLLEQVAGALSAAQIPFVYIDSEAELARYEHIKVVFAPSFEMATRERWQVLETLAADGKHVVYGPHLPTLDDRFRPHVFAKIGGNDPSRLDPAMVHARVHQWIDRFQLERPYPSLPPVETCLHRSDDGDRVLFVLNPGEATVAEVAIPRPVSLMDALTEETFEGTNDLHIPMKAATVRLLLFVDPAQAAEAVE